MNKKDMFIREKLQQDKVISDRANKIFDNIKEEFKVENNEKKTIKISLGTFIAIAASLVIVGFVGISLYANSLGKPNIISGIQALVKDEPEVNVDKIAKELFEKGAYEIRKLEYSSLVNEEYEVADEFIEKEINGRLYVKTNEKYETVEQKYGEIFTGEALENVLSRRFANVNGILYISHGGATGWHIENVEVEKINEENGELTYRASYNNSFYEGDISVEIYTCEFKIKEVNGEYRISVTNYCNLDGTKGNNQNIETETPNQNIKEDFSTAYEKYDDLYWQFKDGEKLTELEWINSKVTIENGSVYLNNKQGKQKVNTINGTAKYINGWGEQTLMRVYIITEEGSIWKSYIDKDELNANFEKVNVTGTIIDMTNGNSSIRQIEPPYFLLSTGDLINEEGSKYEDLEAGFKYSFGSAYDQIFVSFDNTISYYDYENKQYIKIKDLDGNYLKMKDAFIQWSSIYNNLVEETGGYERIFIVTQSGELLYFDGYEQVQVKRYKEANGKIVLSISEEKENIEYGQITNMRVKFTDGSELLLKDAYENYFGKN